MEFKLDELKDNMIELGKIQGLVNIQKLDNHFTMYYDETNNIRKLLLDESKFFNIGIQNIYKNFVLGGLCLENEISNDEIKQLKNDLKLQSTIKEIKIAHIAKGDFLQCLGSEKLTIFLNWLLDNDIYLHYSSLNILFWSIVDIIDSFVEFDYRVARYNYDLKAILYELVKQNLEDFSKLFIKFQYPNIKIEQVNLFLEELINLIEEKKTYITYIPQTHNDTKLTNS